MTECKVIMNAVDEVLREHDVVVDASVLQQIAAAIRVDLKGYERGTYGSPEPQSRVRRLDDFADGMIAAITAIRHGYYVAPASRPETAEADPHD